MKFTASVAASLLSFGLLLAVATPAIAAPPVTVLVNPVTGTCNPDVVSIYQSQGPNVIIFFEIDPAAGNDWSWFDQPAAIVVQAPEGIFTDGKRPGGNGKGKVKLKNRNNHSDVGSYKYTAHLIQDGASTPVSVDPSIENKLD
jgi:hypothetical protein